jgi:rhamnose utilization protein RhaD (predicted bifunctional aldolase and dehydrogenase)/NAD(P)-dependent dehydrogenase (short-subunit alcohol dehydrogenase family)
MMRELRLALLDPTAPTPSVEAILHALIPHRYVDHTHTDAVVTLSNSLGGADRLAEIFGNEVLILPYTMPGFVLAKQVAKEAADADWSSLRGIILLNHGLFTFAEDAKTSYSAMIDLVTRAEEYIASELGNSRAETIAKLDAFDRLSFAELRREAGNVFGSPVLASLDTGDDARRFSVHTDAERLIASGPLTPDHTIHTKPFGAVFPRSPIAGLKGFCSDYSAYFSEHSLSDHRRLDLMPRFGVWSERGIVRLAPSIKRLKIVEDIVAHTIPAILTAERLGGWRPLPRKALFDVEYWELEQAKLKSAATATDASRELEGKVALVTGAASGIGCAAVMRLAAAGAAVCAIDIDESAESQFANLPGVLGLRCDVTDSEQIDSAIDTCVGRFGGLDIVVSNAGFFPPTQSLADLEEKDWERSVALNFTAHTRLLKRCIPLLKLGFDPAVVFIGSKNVLAPGPGAAAYSAAKAGLMQVARIAALELGVHGIRVNTLHPDAVYDTALWTDELLEARANAYGISVEDYKRKNILRTEVASADVAEAVFLLAGTRFGKTTGAQIPVDGGNDRVI